jgi:hypothetical protein
LAPSCPADQLPAVSDCEKNSRVNAGLSQSIRSFMLEMDSPHGRLQKASLVDLCGEPARRFRVYKRENFKGKPFSPEVASAGCRALEQGEIEIENSGHALWLQAQTPRLPHEQ